MRNSGWTFVLTIFILSRLFFFGVGIAAVTYLPPGKPPFFEGGKEVPARGFLDSWANFDGGWYLGIASSGYDLDNPASTAFFPLFPMLIRLGAALGGKPAIWGVLVSLVATFFALYFLYRIAEKHLGLKVARATVLTFAFFPTAFFLNAVYTEALFVALSAGSCWAAAVRRDLLLAGVLGALAAATRNLGVLLLIPLGFEWLYSRILRTLLRKLSLGLRTLVLDLLRLLGASIFDPLLASVLLGREPVATYGEDDGKDQQVHPVPDRPISEARLSRQSYPPLRRQLSFAAGLFPSHGVLLISSRADHHHS